MSGAARLRRLVNVRTDGADGADPAEPWDPDGFNVMPAGMALSFAASTGAKELVANTRAVAALAIVASASTGAGILSVEVRWMVRILLHAWAWVATFAPESRGTLVASGT